MQVSRELTAHDLKTLRNSYGLTQQAMAQELGVPTITYIQWETGRYRIPALLPKALKPILYRAVIQRNQPILDRCAVTLEQYRHEIDRLGLVGKHPDVMMFDAHNQLVYWWHSADPHVFALGESQNGRCDFIVPTSMSPRPELRLPDYLEEGWMRHG